jgi:aspartyl-tRNA(Asn)/glutamyl-tRNA(Gln) amidotransferase subunit A
VEEYLETRRQGFGAEVKRRIMLGTYALSAGYRDAYYLRAQKVRTLIIHDFEAAFERCDVIASPTSPSVAFPLGAKADPVAMYLCDINTIPANLAGIAGVSVPCGLAAAPDGGPELPVGLQLLGPALSEDRLLGVAAQVERDRVRWGRPAIRAGVG